MKNKIKDVEHIEYLTKGHRGMIFVGIYKKKTRVAIKIRNPKSGAMINLSSEPENVPLILNMKLFKINFFFSLIKSKLILEFLKVFSI